MSKDAYTCLDALMTGMKIKNRMEKCGYTIKDIQKKLNFACPQSIYRWMSGQAMPSIDNLYILSNIFGVHMEDLVMPRNDEMWILHDRENKGYKKRMMTYFERVQIRG